MMGPFERDDTLHRGGITTEKTDIVPEEYNTFLRDLKERIRNSQLKAAISVNRELVILYWNIGKEISKRQKENGWGSKLIRKLSIDLQNSFPGIGGFSPRNIFRMRAFYLEYPDGDGQQSDTDEIVPQLVAQIPWGHNIVLLEKVKNKDERIWYIKQTIENGWSRNVLVMQIESDLYGRQNRATTNFEHTLPPEQSDLAEQLKKDPHNFEFLSLRNDADERDVHRSLVDRIQKFLLELGSGFSFVGSQYHLEVGGEDFYIDLLFYHLKLRRYIIIELKNGKFKPEHVGKMNFYLSAVDDLLRHSDDERSIGLILCRERNNVVAEYSVQDLKKPVGISSYQLTRALPEGIKGALPPVEELERELSG